MDELFLNDIILKFQRGEEQLQNFLTQLKDIDIKDPMKAEFKRAESLPGTFEYSLYVSYIPAVGKDIGILLGETVQSFGISLDYLIWALYKNSGKILNESQERKVSFPLVGKKEDFERKLRENHLSHLPSDQLAIMEKYQPYQKTTGGISMGYLRELSNADKHRIIVPVYASSKESEIKIKDKPVGANLLGVTKDYVDAEELKIGTKIITLVMDGEPEKWGGLSMNIVGVYVLPHSIIKPPPPLALAPVDQVLEGIRQTCFDVVTLP